MLFGEKSYVKDLKDENLRGILSEVPEDAVPGLQEKAKAGTLQESDIRQLQTMLQQKNYDIGPMGVDGKLGPRTFDALSHYLKGDPPTKTGTGKTQAIPGVTPLAGQSKPALTDSPGTSQIA
jgi:hypothetical protein